MSSALSQHSEDELRELVEAAEPLGSGIGGATFLLDVGGAPVFVKQVRLTDLERRPEHVGSTANLFDLPMSCHYGVGRIGGPGFGAWRELAAHTMTTSWALAGEYEGFPLLYHWRVLADGGHPLPDELADVDRAVAYWGGGASVRRRIEELQGSSARLLLFLEYIPQNLHDWWDDQIAAGGETAEHACAMVDRELSAGIAFMNARGLLHLDAHFGNVLTDGHRLFFTDFGLAISSSFDLSPEELDFFDELGDYDRCYVASHLVNWLTVALFRCGPQERRAFVRSGALVEPSADVPATAAHLLARDAPIAAVMGEFIRRFQQESRTTPYPREAIGRIGPRDDAPPSSSWPRASRTTSR